MTPDRASCLALLLRDTLDPGLKVYLEYSNEIWNWQFEQTHYTSRHGNLLGLTMQEFQMKRMLELFHVCAPRTFASMAPRLRRSLCIGWPCHVSTLRRLTLDPAPPPQL